MAIKTAKRIMREGVVETPRQQQQDSIRLALIGLLVAAVCLTAALSGCSGGSTDPDYNSADTSQVGGTPAELGAIEPLVPVDRVKFKGVPHEGDSHSPLGPGSLAEGFCLTRIGEALSLIVERSFVPSPLCLQRENPDSEIFQFSRHLAAQNYV
ncbi:MAG: hypothetical protein ABIJ61_07460 [bacterium]